MTPPDDKTTKRLIVDQVFSPNSNAGAVEQMKLVSELSEFKGKYEFHGVIGAGGMGVVYKAKQTMLDRLVAIKMLNAVGFSVADLKRFQQEARAARDLIHPNLIMIRDFGTTGDGQPYMVFDFIEGSTLAEIIKTRGQLEIEKGLDIFIQVAKGLSHAHQRGVLHRDIKPSNIIISEGNREVKIVDFGIAKVIDESTTQQLTKTGEIFGTPLYMSPEQGAGKRLDARSDIYSLGCVMFEALTAVPPLVGESAIYTIIKHQNETPTSLKEASLGKDFPISVEQIVAKSLAKKPDDRYQTAKELVDDLVQAKSSLNMVSAEPVRAPVAPTRRTQFSPISALVIGITIALAVALGNMAKMALQVPAAAPTLAPNVFFPASEFDKMVTGIDLSEQRITPALVAQLAQYSKLERINLRRATLVDQPLRKLRPSFSGANAPGASGVGANPAGANPAGANPAGANPAGANPQNPPGVNPAASPASAGPLANSNARSSGANPSANNPAAIPSSAKSDEDIHVPESEVSFVDLSESNFNDEDMGSLPEGFMPDELILDQTQITDKGMKYLRGSTIQVLSLNNVKGLTDAGLMQTRKLYYLRILRLRGDNITNAGLFLMDSYPRLEELDLRGVSGPITPRAILYLLKCRLLTKLSISDDSLIAAVSHLHQLRELSIYSDTASDEDLLQLKAIPDLTVLDIYGSHQHNKDLLGDQLKGCDVHLMAKGEPPSVETKKRKSNGE